MPTITLTPEALEEIARNMRVCEKEAEKILKSHTERSPDIVEHIQEYLTASARFITKDGQTLLEASRFLLKRHNIMLPLLMKAVELKPEQFDAFQTEVLVFLSDIKFTRAQE